MPGPTIWMVTFGQHHTLVAPTSIHRMDLTPSQAGLKRIRVAQWHDWIFVNLDGKASEFLDYASRLIAHLEGIEFEKVEPYGLLDFGEIESQLEIHHGEFHRALSCTVCASIDHRPAAR